MTTPESDRSSNTTSAHGLTPEGYQSALDGGPEADILAESMYIEDFVKLPDPERYQKYEGADIATRGLLRSAYQEHVDRSLEEARRAFWED